MRVWPLLLVVACGSKPPPAPPPPKPEPPKVHDRDARAGRRQRADRGRHDRQRARAHGRRPAIQAGIAPHTDELSDCYTTKVGKRRWLGGHVALHWDISRAGDITSVKLVESDLGAREIEKCLVDIAKATKFDKPIGGDADFMLPLDFTLKGKVDVWDEDRSLRAVGGQLAKLDNCMKDKKVVKKVKAPPDDVTITVYVGPRGAAQSVGFSSAKSEIADKWAECAVKAAMAWRLPDPKGQIAKLAIRYRP